MVEQAEDGRVRGLVVGRDLERRDGGAVAEPAVGDDSRPAACEHPGGEDVADRAGPGLAACVDHEHVLRA